MPANTENFGAFLQSKREEKKITLRKMADKTINDMVSEYDVSGEAALYRLSDLSLIQSHEVKRYMPGSPLLDFTDFFD